MKQLSDFAIEMTEILLPKNVDLQSWSCIACDQYTQDRTYWDNAYKIASTKPSTLNLILPEVYLDDKDKSERIKAIKNTMKQYLNDNVFDVPKKCFIYTERTSSYGRTRKGLVVAIDLECYEWNPFSKALIRATEKTIPSRIPPRKEIRDGASLELPHIMLLVNDSNNLLIEKLGDDIKSSKAQIAYSGNLMMRGGSISGWYVDESYLEKIIYALNNISENNKDKDGNVLLFAVGDGNHSLATAKALWDEYKLTISEEERKHSRVRYALVEIVNIYDKGLTFEPIHRVIFNVNAQELISDICNKLEGKIEKKQNAKELENCVKSSKSSFGFISVENGEASYLLLKTNITSLAVSLFQPIVDDYINSKNKSGKNITIDYIHGSEETIQLGSKDNTLSVLLPPIDKDNFFATTSKLGVLPRKSFSMGEADEKRFYLECRKLF